MGGGDLNLKKNWHPLTYKNQEAVWKREQEVLAEERKLEQLKKELETERSMQELKQLSAAHGKASSSAMPDRLEWMYQMGAQDNSITTLDKEAYLLGTKSIDALLQSQAKADIEAAAAASTADHTSTSYYGFKANSARDLATKLAEFAGSAVAAATIGGKPGDKLKKKKQKKEKKRKHHRRDDGSDSDQKRKHHRRDDGSDSDRGKRPKQRTRNPQAPSVRSRSPSPETAPGFVLYICAFYT
ncbi:MAG: hypothetical protein SGCHY_003959 [Lobulomycetales sp.]